MRRRYILEAFDYVFVIDVLWGILVLVADSLY